MSPLDVAALAERVKCGDAAADRDLTIAAAMGDLEAQRGLVTIMATENVHALSFAELCRAELMARLAALHGDPYDARRLVALLCALALKVREEGGDPSGYATAAASTLLRLADDGDGHAMAHIANFAADFPEEWARADSSAAFHLPDIPPRPVLSVGDILADAFAVEPPAPTRPDIAPRRFIARLWDRLCALVSRLRGAIR